MHALFAAEFPAFWEQSPFEIHIVLVSFSFTHIHCQYLFCFSVHSFGIIFIARSPWYPYACIPSLFSPLHLRLLAFGRTRLPAIHIRIMYDTSSLSIFEFRGSQLLQFQLAFILPKFSECRHLMVTKFVYVEFYFLILFHSSFTCPIVTYPPSYMMFQSIVCVSELVVTR